jgi:hypothetical protein
VTRFASGEKDIRISTTGKITKALGLRLVPRPTDADD